MTLLVTVVKQHTHALTKSFVIISYVDVRGVGEWGSESNRGEEESSVTVRYLPLPVHYLIGK